MELVVYGLVFVVADFDLLWVLDLDPHFRVGILRLLEDEEVLLCHLLSGDDTPKALGLVVFRQDLLLHGFDKLLLGLLIHETGFLQLVGGDGIHFERRLLTPLLLHDIPLLGQVVIILHAFDDVLHQLLQEGVA